MNYKGDTDGELRVEILPQGPNGEDLDYLQGGASELKGMTVGWTVCHVVGDAGNSSLMNA